MKKDNSKINKFRIDSEQKECKGNDDHENELNEPRRSLRIRIKNNNSKDKSNENSIKKNTNKIKNDNKKTNTHLTSNKNEFSENNIKNKYENVKLKKSNSENTIINEKDATTEILENPENSFTFRSASIYALQNTKKPMGSYQIYDYIKHHGLVNTNGRTPQNTIAALIYTDIKKNNEKSEFIKLNEGFGLRELIHLYQNKSIINQNSNNNINKKNRKRSEYNSKTPPFLKKREESTNDLTNDSQSDSNNNSKKEYQLSDNIKRNKLNLNKNSSNNSIEVIISNNNTINRKGFMSPNCESNKRQPIEDQNYSLHKNLRNLANQIVPKYSNISSGSSNYSSQSEPSSVSSQSSLNNFSYKKVNELNPRLEVDENIDFNEFYNLIQSPTSNTQYSSELEDTFNLLNQEDLRNSGYNENYSNSSNFSSISSWSDDSVKKNSFQIFPQFEKEYIEKYNLKRKRETEENHKTKISRIYSNSKSIQNLEALQKSSTKNYIHLINDSNSIVLSQFHQSILKKLKIENYNHNMALRCPTTLKLESDSIYYMDSNSGVELVKNTNGKQNLVFIQEIPEKRTFAYSGWLDLLKNNNSIDETLVLQMEYLDNQIVMNENVNNLNDTIYRSNDEAYSIIGMDINLRQPHLSGLVCHTCDTKGTVTYGVVKYHGLHLPVIQTTKPIKKGDICSTNFEWNFEEDGVYTICNCDSIQCGGFVEQNLSRTVYGLGKNIEKVQAGDNKKLHEYIHSFNFTNKNEIIESNLSKLKKNDSELLNSNLNPLNNSFDENSNDQTVLDKNIGINYKEQPELFLQYLFHQLEPTSYSHSLIILAFYYVYFINKLSEEKLKFYMKRFMEYSQISFLNRIYPQHAQGLKRFVQLWYKLNIECCNSQELICLNLKDIPHSQIHTYSDLEPLNHMRNIVIYCGYIKEEKWEHFCNHCINILKKYILEK